MEVVFSERAYTSLLAEVKERITTETGGLFLGYYENDTWYIIETVDPGPNSIFQIAYFEYDQSYVKHLLNKLARIYNIRPKLIGLWHRHPGSFDIFSSTDDVTNSKYAQMHPEGAISMLVNLDPDFRLTVYHVKYPHHYSKISYKIGNEYIPNKYFKLKSIDSYFSCINSQKNAENITINKIKEKIVPYIEKISPNFHKIKFSDSSEEKFEHLLDSVVDDLMFLTDEIGLTLKADKKIMGFHNENGYFSFMALCLSDGGAESLIFTITEDEKILLVIENNFYMYKPGLIKEYLSANKKCENNLMRMLKKHIIRKGEE